MKNTVIIAGDFLKSISPHIARARKTIDIIVFDWRWYPDQPASDCQKFNKLIVDAVKRGVRVRCVVNSDDVARQLRNIGADVKKHLSTHLLHAKLMLIDNATVITGSHNYTQSAMTTNYELSVILEEIDNIEQFYIFFNNIWQS